MHSFRTRSQHEIVRQEIVASPVVLKKDAILNAIRLPGCLDRIRNNTWPAYLEISG